MLKVTLRGLFAHKGRLAMSFLAVLLSVAFVTGAVILTETLSGAYGDGGRVPDATVRAVGGAGTIPETLLAKVRAVPGVRTADPDVTVNDVAVTDARNNGIDMGARLSGLGFKTAIPVLAGDWDTSSRSPARIGTGRPPAAPGEVVVDRVSADQAHVRVGDTLRIVAVPGTFQATVTGLADFKGVNPGNTRIWLDLATAQRRLLAKPGMLTSIRVGRDPAVPRKVLAERLTAALGGAAEARSESGGDAPAGMGDTVGFMGTALLGFAGLAVLVGGFLIFNTFSMLTAARTRELGLLRAIGASRRQAKRSVLVEASLLALTGSTLGLPAGIALAFAAKAALAEYGLNLKHTPLTISVTAPAVAYAIGVAVTLVAALAPARRAGRVPPIAALREAAAPPPPARRRRIAVGAVLGAAGAALLVLGSPAAVPGMLLTLLAVVVLGPMILPLVVPRLPGPIGRLGRENTLRVPRRTAATAGALMIGVAAATSLAVSVDSATTSASRRVDRMLGADFMVAARRGEAHFGAEVSAAARRVPGVGSVVREQIVQATLTSGAKRAELSLYGDEPAFPTMMRERYTAGSAKDALTGSRIILVDQVAADLGLKVGDQVRVQTPGGPPLALTVGAIQKQEPPGMSIGRHRTAPTVGLDTLARLSPGASDSALYITLARGADPAKVGAALKTALSPYPQVTVQDRTAYKSFIRSQTSGMLATMYVLLALAITIAVLGVANTLALSVIERTREVGLLRAVGAARSQIRRMIALESVLIALAGTAEGLLLGLAWGAALQRGPDRILAIPWTTIVEIIAVVGLAALAAALIPAVRASRLNILTAIAAD